MRFVLTGRCVVDNQFVERAQLVNNLADIGDTVVDSFSYGADVLVASRSDTNKAVQARALGKPVWTYEQLYRYWELRTAGQSEVQARSAVTNTGRAYVPREIGQSSGVEFRRAATGGIPSVLAGGDRMQFPSGTAVRVEAPRKVEPHPVGHILSNGKRAIDL